MYLNSYMQRQVLPDSIGGWSPLTISITIEPDMRESDGAETEGGILPGV